MSPGTAPAYGEGSWSAATAINMAMALQPDTREVGLAIFDLLFAAECYEEAIDAADELIERDARDATAHARRAGQVSCAAPLRCLVLLSGRSTPLPNAERVSAAIPAKSLRNRPFSTAYAAHESQTVLQVCARREHPNQMPEINRQPHTRD